MAVLFLFSTGAAFGQETVETSKKAEAPVPKSELDNLKAEWEAVREQQVQMILEKEGQLEKLKEEIFAKIKALNAPAAPQPVASGVPEPVLPGDLSGAGGQGNSAEFDAQKTAFKAERQKFFLEMGRQKESLRKLQAALDEKAKKLDTERERFEQGKLTAGR